MKNIWTICIIISTIYAFISNNVAVLVEELLNVPATVLDIAIVLVTTSCLWNGFLNIAKHSGVLEIIYKILKPVLKLVYFDVKNEETLALISTNFLANLLGLGAVASFSAIQAFKLLEIENDDKHTASRPMIMFFSINCIGICLLPMNLIALRMKYNSIDPYRFVIASFIVGSISTIIIIIIDWLRRRLYE